MTILKKMSFWEETKKPYGENYTQIIDMFEG